MSAYESKPMKVDIPPELPKHPLSALLGRRGFDFKDSSRSPSTSCHVLEVSLRVENPSP
jgi:hypothetical protein